MKKEVLITILVFVLIFISSCQYPYFAGKAVNTEDTDVGISEDVEKNISLPTEEIEEIPSEEIYPYDIETLPDVIPDVEELYEIESEIIVQREIKEEEIKIEEPMVIEEDKRIKYFKRILEFPKIDLASGLKESFKLVDLDKVKNTLSKLRERLRIPSFKIRLIPEPSAPESIEAYFLHVEGTSIVDENGEEVFLKGINFGDWLAWETCAYGILNCGDFPEHKLRQELEARMDEGDVDLFFELIKENFIQSGDLGIAKDEGYNFVRLAFHHRYVNETELTILDEAINWARENDIYVMLDMHAAPGSQNTAYFSDSNGTAWLWLNPDYQDEFIEKWEILAERYRDEPIIVGYELLNEPLADDSQLWDLYNRTIASIRAIDNNHIIFLDGNYYAGNFNVFNPIFEYDNLVYVFHGYASFPEPFLTTLYEFEEFRDKYQVPIMCNEYGGENALELASIFEDRDIPYAPWTYKYATPGSSYIAYHLPVDNLWSIWLKNISIEMNASGIIDDVLQLINESNLSEACKQNLTEYIISNNRLPGYRDIVSLAITYPGNEEELRELFAEMWEMYYSCELDIIAASLNLMSLEELTSLTESLQTQYCSEPLPIICNDGTPFLECSNPSINPNAIGLPYKCISVNNVPTLKAKCDDCGCPQNLPYCTYTNPSSLGAGVPIGQCFEQDLMYVLNNDLLFSCRLMSPGMTGSINTTGGNIGLDGADLGIAVWHNNEIYYFFGDASGAMNAENPYAKSSTVFCPGLNWFLNETTGLADSMIDWLAEPGTNVPSGAISLNGNIYVYIMRNIWSGPNSAYSYLVKSVDNGLSFDKVENVEWPFGSKFINIAPIEGELNGQDVVFFLATGNYGASPVYLGYTTNIEDINAYMYFIGLDINNEPEWSTNPDDAVAVIDVNNGRELSVAWSDYLNKYITVFTGGGIKYGSSENLWGPWEVVSISNIYDFNPVFSYYGGYIVPEMSHDDELYVVISTWSPYTSYIMNFDLDVLEGGETGYNLEFVSWVLYGAPFDIEIIDDDLYVDINALVIMNISNETNPTEISHLRPLEPGEPTGIEVQGDYAYTYWHGKGIRVIDISDKSNPIIVVDNFQSSYEYTELYVDSNYLYGIAEIGWNTGEFYFHIIDISNPLNPILVGNFNLSEIGIGINRHPLKYIIDGDIVYLISRPPFKFEGQKIVQLHLLNISVPENINSIIDSIELGEVDIGSYPYIDKNNNYIYVTGYYSETQSTLKIIDVSDINNPIVYDWTGSFRTIDIKILNNYAYITNSNDGIYILELTDPLNPQELDNVRMPLPDYYPKSYNLKVLGNRAYMYYWDSHAIFIVDISDPNNLSVIDENGIEFGHALSDAAISDNNYLYAAIWDWKQLHTVDMTNPELPEVVNRTEVLGGGWGVYVEGNYVYETMGTVSWTWADSGGLQIIDISNPESPIKVGYSPPHEGKNLDVQVYVDSNEMLAYVAIGLPLYESSGLGNHSSDEPGMRIVNVSDPSNPVEIGNVTFGSYESQSRSIHKAGNYAYIAANNGGLYIIDVSDPTNPTIVSQWIPSINRALRAVFVKDNYAYVGYSLYLGILDVSDPQNPNLVNEIDLSSSVNDVIVNENLAFIVGGNCLKVVDITDPNNIVEIASQVDVFGHQPVRLDVKEPYIYVTTLAGGVYTFIFEESTVSDECEDGTPIGECSGVGNAGTYGKPYKCELKNNIPKLIVNCTQCGEISPGICEECYCYYDYNKHTQIGECEEKTANVLFSDPLENQEQVEKDIWNDGSVYGGSFELGKSGYSYYPNGGYITFPFNKIPKNNRTYYSLRCDRGSIELWINPQEGFETGKGVFFEEGIDDNKASVYYENGQIKFLRANEDDSVILSKDVEWQQDEWHHILASWGVYGTRLYVDGNLTYNPSDKGLGNFSDNITIGADTSGENSAAFLIEGVTTYGYQKTNLGLCEDLDIDYECMPVSDVYKIKVEFTTNSTNSFLKVNNSRVDNVNLTTQSGLFRKKWEFDDTIFAIEDNTQTINGEAIVILDQLKSGEDVLFNLGKSCNGDVNITIYNYNTGELVEIGTYTNDLTSGCGLYEFTINSNELMENGPYSTVTYEPYFENLVWVYYYPWYGEEFWNNFNTSLTIQDIYPVQKGILGHYESVNETLIRAHIQEAKANGIDGFVIAGTFWNGEVNYDVVDTILNISEEEDFKISVAIESPSWEAEIGDVLGAALNFYNVYNNSDKFYEIDGKKVIFWWNTASFSKDELQTGVFDVLSQYGYDGFDIAMHESSLSSDILNYFDGISTYIPSLDVENTYLYDCARSIIARTYSLLYGDKKIIIVPTLNPGYDERMAAYGQTKRMGNYQDRCDGAIFNHTFEAAIQSYPDWFIITSWNEFPEHTYIEPDEYMEINYLDYVKSYSDEFKTMYTSCEYQNGHICEENQYCGGELIEASNTERCCSIECSDALLCEECGGLFGFGCSRNECYIIPEGCYFIDIWLWPNDCNSCSGATCSSYTNDQQTCIDDPCGLGNCEWFEGECITSEPEAGGNGGGNGYTPTITPPVLVEEEEEIPLTLYTLEFTGDFLETILEEGKGYLLKIDNYNYTLIVNEVNNDNINLDIDSVDITVTFNVTGKFDLIDGRELYINLLNIDGNKATVRFEVKEKEVPLTEEVPRKETRGELITQTSFIISFVIICLILIGLIIFFIYKTKVEIKKRYNKEKIKEVIEDALKRGYSKQRIKNKFLKEGWPEKLIDKFLKKFS